MQSFDDFFITVLITPENNDGWTPLHTDAFNGHLKIWHAIIEIPDAILVVTLKLIQILFWRFRTNIVYPKVTGLLDAAAENG